MDMPSVLQSHYCDDTVSSDRLRADIERWERVMGDPLRFPNADLVSLDALLDAGYEYLPHAPEVEEYEAA